MKTKALVLLPLVAMLMLAFPTQRAEAQTLSYSQQEIDILELERPPFGFEFVVTNPIGGQDIIAFGVRNDTIQPFPAPWISSEENMWAGARLFDEWGWDNDQFKFWNGEGYSYAPFSFWGTGTNPDGTREVLTSSGLGTFRNLFGDPAIDPPFGQILGAQVAFYFDDDEQEDGGPDPIIGDGSPRGGFFFDAQSPASPFIAVRQGPGGGPINVLTGQTTLVPLPSAAWLGLGMLSVLGAVRRLRKRRAA